VKLRVFLVAVFSYNNNTYKTDKSSYASSTRVGYFT